jgi:hypothetical protein
MNIDYYTTLQALQGFLETLFTFVGGKMKKINFLISQSGHMLQQEYCERTSGGPTICRD